MPPLQVARREERTLHDGLGAKIDALSKLTAKIASRRATMRAPACRPHSESQGKI